MASISAALPPGPEISPQQQAKEWIERPLALLDDCARRFGDVFTLQLGALGSTVMFSHPEAVRTIFQSPPQLFECQHFNESYRFVMGDHALFLLDGEKHRRVKRTIAPLLCHERLEPRARDICKLARETVQLWSMNRTQQVRPLMHQLALSVLMRIVFGDRQEAGALVEGWFATEIWRDRRAWKPWANLSRIQPRLRTLISSELEYRRGANEPDREPDLLDQLLASRYENGQALSEMEMQDQVLTFTITAVDPVAFALTWLLAWVARTPAVQSTLCDELATLGNEPNPLAVLQLPFFSATCQEVLRIHPILPTVEGRRLLAPAEFHGYQFEPGINVAPCAYLVHRREDLFPEPLAFRPERFLSRRYSAYEYFPFGGSNRHCLGTSLAPMEMKLVLATILARGRLFLEDPGGPDVRYGTMVAPDDELRIGFNPL
jgi:unspecific monooxygenase